MKRVSYKIFTFLYNVQIYFGTVQEWIIRQAQRFGKYVISRSVFFI